MSTGAPAWPHLIGLGEARRGASLRLVADDTARAAIAAALELVALEQLEAEVTLTEWLDGVLIAGAWRARIAQICGISLDPFETNLEGRFKVLAVPLGSANAPAESLGEVEIDAEAEDPPDVLESESIDVGAYVIEHLALEIDPFPRKPGVTFEAPDAPTTPSPFDALRALKRD
ncbi:MAG TPA: YceD family protein [Caulobacteraceae bacterium]|jgi:uncharacterized metal-binding protein YceD (DUF177 family)|nr:YceD family protein [Caulobacteraceae bacterium]